MHLALPLYVSLPLHCTAMPSKQSNITYKKHLSPSLTTPRLPIQLNFSSSLLFIRSRNAF